MNSMRPVLLVISLLWGWVASAADYLRVRETPSGTAHLDIAVQSFEIGPPLQRRTLQLVGVAHIGEAEYYAEIQQILDAADKVLFEGVDGHREEFRSLHLQEDSEREGHLQARMAKALALEFQLFALRYDRPHFVNSDVTSEQLRDLFNGKERLDGAKLDDRDMDDLMDQMQALSFGGQMMVRALDVLEAHPHWGRAMRWCMVNMMGSLQGDVTEYAGFPPDLREMMVVLIHKRNDVVMEDIRASLTEMEPGQTLAVFYGAAHMPDFDARLMEEFQAHRGEKVWLSALNGNLKTSGLNVIEQALLNGFMQQQLAVLRMLAQPAPEAKASEAVPVMAP